MKKHRLHYDILNIIAIIAVIGMHVNSIVHANPMVRAWNSSLIIECIFYFAVPLFLMLTGAKLLNYREKYDTKTFFKKRFVKILIPLIFWSIFMYIFKTQTQQTCEIKNITEFLNAFFLNKFEYTYYFMWSILGIYLTLPLLSLIAKKENAKVLWFTVILYFIVNSFIPNILGLFNIKYNMDATVLLGGYLIYIILGWLIDNETLPKKYNKYIYIGAIIGLIYRYLTTFVLSKNAGIVIRTTWGYTSWHAILLTTSIFLLVKNMDLDNKIKNEKIKNTILKISSCSFGIYLIHLIVIYYEKLLLNIESTMWQWRTFGIISTYLISLGIVFLLKKIPVIKRLVP